jgi:hypothetical protein
VSAQSAHVLQQDCPRIYLLDKPECLGKQVPVIVLAELLASYRKWRARHSTRKQVNACVCTPIYVADIVFDDLPLGSTVQAKGFAGVRIQLNGRLVDESGLL